MGFTQTNTICSMTITPPAIAFVACFCLGLPLGHFLVQRLKLDDLANDTFSVGANGRTNILDCLYRFFVNLRAKQRIGFSLTLLKIKLLLQKHFLKAVCQSARKASPHYCAENSSSEASKENVICHSASTPAGNSICRQAQPRRLGFVE